MTTVAGFRAASVRCALPPGDDRDEVGPPGDDHHEYVTMKKKVNPAVNMKCQIRAVS